MPVVAAQKASKGIPGDQQSTTHAAHSGTAVQSPAGNQAMQALLSGGWLRPKLELGASDDPEEREADAVADRVMRMPGGGACCASCGDGGSCEDETVRGSSEAATPAPRSTLPRGLEHQVRRLTTGGETLSPSLRAFFEPRLGRNLADVRVHRDTETESAAAAIRAKAFTLGEHIAFGPGHWSPDTATGKRLLAHELAHVAQEGRKVRRQDSQTEAVPRPGELVVPTGEKPLGTLEPPEWAPPGQRIFQRIGAELYKAAAYEAAAARYDNPLHKELVWQYVYGDGAPLLLDKDKMSQVIGKGSLRLNIFKHFPAVQTSMKALEAQLAARGGGTTSEPFSEELVASASISTTGFLGCDSDKPSLGGFTCYLTGTLEARVPTNSDTINYEFSGTMRWFDTWDFDPRRPARPGEEAGATPVTRTRSGEVATRMGAAFLPGTPFNVESEEVPVRQKDLDQAPEW